MDIIDLYFKPEAKDKLLQAEKMNSSEVVIAFCGRPRATVSIKKIINAIDNKTAIPLVHPVSDPREIFRLEQILKSIMDGTWGEEKK